MGASPPGFSGTGGDKPRPYNEKVQQLRIGFSEINYRIERSGRRRTICITVHPLNGVVVKAPPWAAESEIEHFVRQKAGWISKHLSIFASLPAPIEGPGRSLSDGCRLPLLGRELTLRRRESLTAGLRSRSRVVLHGDALLLDLKLAPGSDADTEARRALESWYRRQARSLLLPRIAHFCAQLGLAVPTLFIRDQKRRWGSCSSRGEIRINWRIILGPPDVADYLCAHEVCHLRQMNHSPRFWRLVEKLLPDYKRLRQQLKLEGHLYTL